MKGPRVGDKVFLGDRKTALRVLSIGKLYGEKAVELTNEWAKRALFKRGRTQVPPRIVRTIAISDLIRDVPRRGWREMWGQGGLELGEATVRQEDVS